MRQLIMSRLIWIYTVYIGIGLFFFINSPLYTNIPEIFSVLFQFPDVVSFCDQMADKGKIIIVAALDGTFQRQVLYFVFITQQSLWPSLSSFCFRN